MGKKSRLKLLRKTETLDTSEPEVLKNVQPPTNSSIAVRSSSFSGPIPHPSMLRGYEDVLPGSAERILKMAENQSAHRIEMEKSVVGSDIKKSERGQLFGLIIAILGFVIAFILAILGRQAVAIVIAALDITSIVGLFVYGQIRKSNKRKTIKETTDRKPEEQSEE